MGHRRLIDPGSLTDQPSFPLPHGRSSFSPLRPGLALYVDDSDQEMEEDDADHQRHGKGDDGRGDAHRPEDVGHGRAGDQEQAGGNDDDPAQAGPPSFCGAAGRRRPRLPCLYRRTPGH
jgi:hypothetical protein